MNKGITIKVTGLDENPCGAFLTALEKRLQYIGERAIQEARSKTKQNDWHDVTGNLRASIGYVVLRDGKPLKESKFEQNSTDGTSKARAFLSELTSQFPQGLVLIVCAGMQYASYVEAKGYNVLSSASTIARELVDKLQEQLKK